MLLAPMVGDASRTHDRRKKATSALQAVQRVQDHLVVLVLPELVGNVEVGQGRFAIQQPDLVQESPLDFRREGRDFRLDVGDERKHEYLPAVAGCDSFPVVPGRSAAEYEGPLPSGDRPVLVTASAQLLLRKIFRQVEMLEVRNPVDLATADIGERIGAQRKDHVGPDPVRDLGDLEILDVPEWFQEQTREPFPPRFDDRTLMQRIAQEVTRKRLEQFPEIRADKHMHGTVSDPWRIRQRLEHIPHIIDATDPSTTRLHKE